MPLNFEDLPPHVQDQLRGAGLPPTFKLPPPAPAAPAAPDTALEEEAPGTAGPTMRPAQQAPGASGAPGVPAEPLPPTAQQQRRSVLHPAQFAGLHAHAASQTVKSLQGLTGKGGINNLMDFAFGTHLNRYHAALYDQAQREL